MKDFVLWQKQLKDSVRDNIETMLPAEIHSYDHQTKLAEVRVLVSLQNSDDNFFNIPILKDVSVSYPSFNGFEISYPLKAGDIGRICIFSKDLDKYKKTGGLQAQKNESRFNFHNAIFVPDLQISGQSNISSSDNFVIGRKDGGLVIELTPENEAIIKQHDEEKIKLKTDGTVNIKPIPELDFELNKDKEITVRQDSILKLNLDDSGNWTIIGNVSQIGNLLVTGNITCTEGIVGLTVADAVSTMGVIRSIYNEHTHPGDSGGTTGTPNTSMV